jgi:hypothetical protein
VRHKKPNKGEVDGEYRAHGRQLWKAMEKTLLSGGREGSDWAVSKGQLLAAIGAATATFDEGGREQVLAASLPGPTA